MRVMRCNPPEEAEGGNDQATNLAEILNIEPSRARQILEEADNNVEAATNLYFAQQENLRAGPSSNQNATGNSRSAQLHRAIQEMGLPSINQQQASRLLRNGGNSIERALELYLENPSSAGGAGAPAPAPADEPIVISSSSDDDDAGNDGNNADGNNDDGSDSNSDSDSSSSSDSDEGGNQDAAANYGWTVMPMETDPYDDDDIGDGGGSDDDDDSDGSSDDSSLSDDSEPTFENQEEMWEAACEAYDEHFQQEVIPPSSVSAGSDEESAKKPLPSLEEAFYRASRKYTSKLSKEKLPFEQYRKRDGSLYAPATVTDIPALAPPLPTSSTKESFLLGTILLPVHSVNRTVLSQLDSKRKPGTKLEWGSTSPAIHDYVTPVWQHSEGIWAQQISNYHRLAGSGAHNIMFGDGMFVQLSLGGPKMADTEAWSFPNALHLTEQMPAVTVRSKQGWMKQFLSSLERLEQGNIIAPVFSLVRPGEEEEEEEEEEVEKEIANGAGASTGRKRSKSSPPEDKTAPTTSTAASGSGSGAWKSKKKAKVGATGKPVASKKASPAKPRRPLPLPTHVKVAVYLSTGAVNKFYKGSTGDILEWVSTKGSPAARKLGVPGVWSHYPQVFAYLYSALLTHGQGTLRLGPDSDGLLNVCDVSKEESDHVDQMSPHELSSQFNVANILNSISVTPEIAAKRGRAQMPKGMRSRPKRYQLSGLKWMLDREQKGDALERGQLALHPAWIQFISESGNVFYVHRIKQHVPTFNFFTAPPQGTCGGFICDEMGLGKSLQTLMLVQEHPPPRGWAVEKFTPDMLVSQTEPIPIKTTLLVAPTTLLTQWEEEIGKHLAPNTLKYGRFVDPMDRKAMLALRQNIPDDASDVAVVAGKRSRRGPRLRYGIDDGASGSKGKKSPVKMKEKEEIGSPIRRVVCALPDGSAAEIQTLDICLCSYEDLREQLGASHGNTVSALQQFGYWRVCLDEAQLIANSSSVAAVMASSLWRRHAWVVTGTPISNRLSEVRGLLEFLALEPYFHNAAWSDLVQSGCDDKERHGLLSLRSLLRGVMLRRSKQDVADELDLPPCLREDLPVVLSTAERAAYERLKREFLDAVKQYRRHQEANANFVRTTNNHAEETQRSRALSKSTARAYGSLVSLRQSTCHPQMVASNAALMGSERLSMTDIIDRLVTQAYSEFDGALRAYFDETVYKLAVEVCTQGESPVVCFSSVLQAIDDNATVAGLLMLPRNSCISLRKENGAMNHAFILDSTRKVDPNEVDIVVREKILALEKVDMDECDFEDDELEERRVVYRQQLKEIAEKWDLENEEKEAKKKKPQKGGSKKSPAKKAAAAAAAAAAAGGAGAGGEAAEGEQQPVARKAPSFRAMKYARTELGEMPDLPAKRKQLRREAANRRRNWDRLKLAVIELKLHLIKEEIGFVRGKWTPEAKARAAPRKESGQSEIYFAETNRELEALRTELGLVPDFASILANSAAAAAAAGGGGAGGSTAPVAGGSGEGAALENAPTPVQANNDTTTTTITGVDGTNTNDEVNGTTENGTTEENAGTSAAAAFMDAGLIRRSRRQAGIGADSTAQLILNSEELAAQLDNAVIMIRQYKSICAGRVPAALTQRHVDTALNAAKELFHRLKFVNQQHQDVTRFANMTAAAAGGADGASGSGGGGNEDVAGQDDLTRCPICFDDLTTTPITMTRCSHRFCTDCIREALTRAAPQPAPCPICRTDLRQSDLFEAMSEAEAVVAARAAAATNNATAEYGAKVAAVLDIIKDMYESEGPGSKCLIFSSWGRALRLVGDALTANDIRFASLAGSVSTKRADLLNEFMHDPDCTVLLVLMSTSGGAAGLTLTMASTAILLEPCINPGLEAQAAARIYRMGQTKPTRVVRLIAEESVDVQIAEQQRRKVEASGGVDAASGNIKTDEADYGTIVALADRLAEAGTGGGAGPVQEDAGPAAAGGAGPSRPR